MSISPYGPVCRTLYPVVIKAGISTGLLPGRVRGVWLNPERERTKTAAKRLRKNVEINNLPVKSPCIGTFLLYCQSSVKREAFRKQSGGTLRYDFTGQQDTQKNFHLQRNIANCNVTLRKNRYPFPVNSLCQVRFCYLPVTINVKTAVA